MQHKQDFEAVSQIWSVTTSYHLSETRYEISATVISAPRLFRQTSIQAQICGLNIAGVNELEGFPDWFTEVRESMSLKDSLIGLLKYVTGGSW